MKKKIVLGLVAATLLSSMPLNASAVGNATINFKSEDKVSVGDNIKVYMSIDDIENANNGIVGVGGKLEFDSELLELVEAKTVNTPYDFWFNPKSNKLAGLDFTFERAINKDTVIYEFNFKTLKAGFTTITLDEAELTDSKTDVLASNVYGKNITISEKEAEEVTEEKIENTKVEVKKAEVKEETKKEKITKVNNYVHSLLKRLSELF